jgi:carboxyl-terminal processing protease
LLCHAYETVPFYKEKYSRAGLKLQDLQHFKKEISDLLTDEIISRYYYQKGAIKAALRDDSDIKKAIEILHKPDGYAAIFDKGRIIKAN